MVDFDLDEVVDVLIEERLLLLVIPVSLPFELEYSEDVFVFFVILLGDDDDDDCDDMSKRALSCETMVKFVEARG